MKREDGVVKATGQDFELYEQMTRIRQLERKIDHLERCLQDAGIYKKLPG